MSQVPPPTAPTDPAQVVPVCYRHPKRETYLRCVRCDRPICPECLREAPVGYQCPECVAQGRRSVRAARTIFGGGTVGDRGYVTKALIAINVAVLVASAALAGGGGLFGGGLGGVLSNPTRLTQAGAVWGLAQYTDGRGHVISQVPAGIATGEYYRLFTSMFLHYGLVHLLLNMWALWVLGRELEARLGPGRYLLLYLMAGLGGSVACYVFTPAAQAAGASGAIYGLFGGLFVVFRKMRWNTSSIIIVLAINLFFSISVPGISLAAHVGGLLVGAAIGVALAYPPAKIRTRVLAATVTGFGLLFVFAVIAQTAHINAITG